MMLIFVLIGFLLLFVVYYFFFSYSKSNLPPLSPSSFWKNMKTEGYQRIVHFYNESIWCSNNTKQDLKNGCVYRLSMPLRGGLVICCDYKLGKLILGGNEEKDIPESEKTKLIQTLNIFDNVCNLLTYKTANPERIQARKFLAPAFSTNNLQKTTLEIVYHRTNNLIVKLHENSKKKEFVDVKDSSIMLIFDILTESLFDVSLSEGSIDGFDCKEFMNVEEITLREAVSRVSFDTYSYLLNSLSSYLSKLMNPLRPYFFWDPQVQRGLKARDKLQNFGRVIAEAYRSNKFNLTDSTHEKTIMSHIMRHDYPTEENRISDILVFLVAGHETTAHTLSFILYCLAKHPTIRKKLQQELDLITPSITSESTPILSLNDISKCEYLNNCIKETQRLYPVAPVVSRTVLQDIHHNGMTIPKDFTVLVVMSAMFRQPWIQNPHEYQPERWNEDAPQIESLKEMLIPFSHGKRNCIGQNLALMEIRIIVANLVRQFDFELKNDEIELDLFVTLKPIELKMKFTSRQ